MIPHFDHANCTTTNISKQKGNFGWMFWRQSWKTATVYDFQLANQVDLISNAWKIIVPISMLVSSFARFFCHLLHYILKSIHFQYTFDVPSMPSLPSYGIGLFVSSEEAEPNPLILCVRCLAKWLSFFNCLSHYAVYNESDIVCNQGSDLKCFLIDQN